MWLTGAEIDWNLKKKAISQKGKRTGAESHMKIVREIVNSWLHQGKIPNVKIPVQDTNKQGGEEIQKQQKQWDHEH